MDIVLKKWTMDDKDELINICNNADRKFLSNRIPYPYKEEDAIFWLNMVAKDEGSKGIFRAIMVDGKCVGNITLEKKSDVSCKDAEIGYLLLSNKWSKGIMTKCVEEICNIGFSKLDIVRITGIVYKPNLASKRVLEKNGFILEGIMKNAVFKNDNLYDKYIYGKYK